MMLPSIIILIGAMLSPPEPYSPPQTIPNILTYDDGTVEVDASINAYDNLTETTPIVGSVFVTQEKPVAIDINAFRLGDQPLKVTAVNDQDISSDSPISVSIYTFTLPPMSVGIHNLPPITVKVGNKTYQSLPLSIEVSPKS